MIYKKYNTVNDLKLITLANTLIDYVPHQVRKDKYYRLISRDLIQEICLTNKAVINGIINKNQLNVDDYRELLNAIGYMLYDHCKNKMYSYCQKIERDYKDYDFVSKYPLIDIAMGKHDNQFMWCVKNSRNKISLVKYKFNKKGELIVYKGNNAEQVITNARCIQIGKLKAFVSDIDKKVYCLSIDNELLYVVKNEDNSYQYYSKSA